MSERLDRLNLPSEELKSLLLESLKDVKETQYLEICIRVANLAIKKNIAEDPLRNVNISGATYYLHREDEDKIRELIWYLIFERILTIGVSRSSENWPWLKVTDYGEKIVESKKPIPHDPFGYIKRIKDEITNIDDVILTYLQESLETYNINALLSSTITLGCASEKVLLLVIDAYINSISDSTKKNKFINKINNRFIKTKFEEFQKSLTSIIGILPKDLSDNLNIILIGIFEMIRKNRNNAGHPTGKLINKEELFAHLQIFIPYCKKAYQLIDYFSKNKI